MTAMLWDELKLWWLQNVTCKHPHERCVTERHPYRLKSVDYETMVLTRVCRACGKVDV